jgi:flagellar biosynthetic protein FlhB
MADANKTEQATPQRRRKAREKGQIARSRDLSSSLALFAVLFVISWQGSSAVLQWRQLFARVLDAAAESELRVGSPLGQWTLLTALNWCVPAMLAALMVGALGAIAQGGPVFATALLAPSMGRISPAQKASQLFSTTSLAALLKSLIPFTFIGVIAYQVVTRDWQSVSILGFATSRAMLAFLLDHSYEIAWKSALVLLLWSGFDYLLARQKHERELRMTRQEIREEAKESEGNPQIKAQIRRIQRQRRRKQMLRDVERATVVVTNPTHFAIALEYAPDMAAPVVVAKGRNLLAQQIKQAAVWHGVPMIENPPLAHALYRTVEVGQAIPAKLFTAVAEILAFVYRMQQRVANGGR